MFDRVLFQIIRNPDPVSESYLGKGKPKISCGVIHRSYPQVEPLVRQMKLSRPRSLHLGDSK